jgi:hypothetical protein
VLVGVKALLVDPNGVVEPQRDAGEALAIPRRAPKAALDVGRSSG